MTYDIIFQKPFITLQDVLSTNFPLGLVLRVEVCLPKRVPRASRPAARSCPLLRSAAHGDPAQSGRQRKVRGHGARRFQVTAADEGLCLPYPLQSMLPAGSATMTRPLQEREATGRTEACVPKSPGGQGREPKTDLSCSGSGTGGLFKQPLS